VTKVEYGKDMPLHVDSPEHGGRGQRQGCNVRGPHDTVDYGQRQRVAARIQTKHNPSTNFARAWRRRDGFRRQLASGYLHMLRGARPQCAALHLSAFLNQGFSGDMLEEYGGWSALLATNAAVRCCGVAEKQTHAFDQHADRVAADVAISIILPRRFASSRHRRAACLMIVGYGLLRRAEGDRAKVFDAFLI
jgi:hypothetical protein